MSIVKASHVSDCNSVVVHPPSKGMCWPAKDSNGGLCLTKDSLFNFRTEPPDLMSAYMTKDSPGLQMLVPWIGPS